MVLFGSVLSGTLCAFWTWVPISFPRFGDFFQIYSLPLSLSSSSGTPVLYNVNINVFDVISNTSQTILTLSFFSPASLISTTLSSSSLICSSVPSNLPLIPFGDFFLSVIVFFLSVLFLFIFSSSAKNSDFSVCPMFSGLLRLPSPWTLLGILLLSPSFNSSFGVLSYFFTGSMFLCYLILPNFLFLFLCI